MTGPISAGTERARETRLKHLAVWRVLDSDANLSDRAIAADVDVSPAFVARVRGDWTWCNARDEVADRHRGEQRAEDRILLPAALAAAAFVEAHEGRSVAIGVYLDALPDGVAISDLAEGGDW